MINKICHFRLQPIVKIDKLKVKAHAYEVLVELCDVHRNQLDDFFSSLPIFLHRSLFKEQVNIFSSLPGIYFINIPVELLMTCRFASRLTQDKDNINIEIQNPIKLFDLNPYEIEQVKREILLLQSNGVNVWLDDIDDRFVRYAIELGVYGVKIDKNVVWSDYNLSEIRSGLRNTNIKILAEGIENISHYSKSLSSGVDMAQGFLWPEIQVNSEGRIL